MRVVSGRKSLAGGFRASSTGAVSKVSNRSLGIIAVLSAVIWLAGCESVHEKIADELLKKPSLVDGPGQSIDPAKLQEELVGNSVLGPEDDVPFTVYFAALGEMRGIHSNNYRDEGVWRFVGQDFCARWQNWWGHVERCWEMRRAGQTLIWRLPYGDTTTAATIVPGNPANL